MGTPTGGGTWQLLDSRQWNAAAGTKVWWKVAGSSEPSTYGFTQGSSADGVVVVAAVQDAADTAPLVAQTGADSSSTTVPTPTITPASIDDLELRWAAGGGPGDTVTWTPPATYTEAADVQSGTFTTGTLATKQLSSSAATGAQNFTASVAPAYHHGFTVAVAAPSSRSGRAMVSTAAAHRASSW